MPRRRIFRDPRPAIYANVSIDVADAIVARAEADQVPQRVVIEAALRAYLGIGGARSQDHARTGSAP